MDQTKHATGTSLSLQIAIEKKQLAMIKNAEDKSVINDIQLLFDFDN